jgi:spore coat polysaccharide biosynthesis predicted glycosyltransferase SpsG
VFVRIEFYVDCSPTHGTGHVMRSSVLGLELARKGNEVCFFGNLDQPRWVSTYLNSNDICAHGLRSQNRHIVPPSLVFVDTYSQVFFNEVAEANPDIGIISIEDAFTPRLESSIKIIQVLDGALNLDRESHNNAKLITGNEFMLVRESLSRVTKVESKVDLTADVLVMTGGTNSTGFSSAFGQIAAQLQGNFTFHIIGERPLGLNDPKNSLRYYPLGTLPEELNISFAAAVSLAGVSSIEILSIGIPLVLSAGTENQLPLYRYLTSGGYAVSLIPKDFKRGWTFTSTDLQQSIFDALNLKAKNLNVDFLGAHRIMGNLEYWLNLKF